MSNHSSNFGDFNGSEAEREKNWKVLMLSAYLQAFCDQIYFDDLWKNKLKFFNLRYTHSRRHRNLKDYVKSS